MSGGTYKDKLELAQVQSGTEWDVYCSNNGANLPTISVTGDNASMVRDGGGNMTVQFAVTVGSGTSGNGTFTMTGGNLKLDTSISTSSAPSLKATGHGTINLNGTNSNLTVYNGVLLDSANSSSPTMYVYVTCTITGKLEQDAGLVQFAPNATKTSAPAILTVTGELDLKAGTLAMSDHYSGGKCDEIIDTLVPVLHSVYIGTYWAGGNETVDVNTLGDTTTGWETFLSWANSSAENGKFNTAIVPAGESVQYTSVAYQVQ